MKKTLISILLIPLLCAGATYGVWTFLNHKAEPKADAAEKGDADAKKKPDHDEEGGTKVKFTEEQRKAAQLGSATAGPMKLKQMLPLYGKITTNEERTAHVMPRFPGVVKSVKKRLGDKVEKGEVLATVESNESLRTYELISEIAGTVIEKDASLGEFVRDEKAIFVIADLSTVWVDLNVYRQDFALLHEGLPVLVKPDEGAEPIASTFAYLSPFGAENTQTMLARVVIPNPKGDLRAGLFVTAQAITGEVDAPVTVKLGALQTLKDKTVVFVEEGDSFEAREVELGARDNENVEIISGVLPGEKYIAENSFIVKSQLLKSQMVDED